MAAEARGSSRKGRASIVPHASAQPPSVTLTAQRRWLRRPTAPANKAIAATSRVGERAPPRSGKCRLVATAATAATRRVAPRARKPRSSGAPASRGVDGIVPCRWRPSVSPLLCIATGEVSMWLLCIRRSRSAREFATPDTIVNQTMITAASWAYVPRQGGCKR